VSYLLKTTSPYFHSFHYGGDPGAAAKQLEDDLWNTVEHYDYSNLKIREVGGGRLCGLHHAGFSACD
jgi:hypothetical protein